jgi:hypothetical protein
MILILSLIKKKYKFKLGSLIQYYDKQDAIRDYTENKYPIKVDYSLVYTDRFNSREKILQLLLKDKYTNDKYEGFKLYLLRDIEGYIVNNLMYLLYLSEYHKINKRLINIYFYDRIYEKYLVEIYFKKCTTLPSLLFYKNKYIPIIRFFYLIFYNLFLKNYKPLLKINISYINIFKNILIFPHKSLSYGKLFSKDYIIPNDNKLFNLTYIESEFSDDVQNDYKNRNINPIYLNSFKVKLSTSTERMSYRRFNYYLYLKSKLKFGLLENSIFPIYYKYLYEKKKLKIIFKSLNPILVIVGYDQLFPSIYSTIFRELKIPMIAICERPFMCFTKVLSLNLNFYLTPGLQIDKAIKSDKFNKVDNTINIGIMRSDNFFKNKNYLLNSKSNILVLDFHSSNENLISHSSWNNNLIFYKDILKLANFNKNFNFIIRGKNVDWMKLEYFKEIVSKINDSKNLEIDQNYETNNSYQIVLESDLIIARPTSIADEAISYKKKVIFYDRYDCDKSVFKEVFNYNGLAYFAESYLDLQAKFSQLLYNKVDIDIRKVEETFGIADGKVRDRYNNFLSSFLEQKK